MKLICYPTGGRPLEIRPAPATRDWMDALPQQYGYRCLPLNIANAHGWEILSPITVEARWDGGTGREAIRVTVVDAEAGAAEGAGEGAEAGDAVHAAHAPTSHFGSGILTFHTGYLMETEPGYNLWVSGPPNIRKAGIAPLTGVVETDWSPYAFTMNWVFTAAHTTVRFAAGEPICFFFPVPRGVVEACAPEIRELDESPEKAADFRAWSGSRKGFLADLPEHGTEANAQRWQKRYFRGQRPDGAPGVADHRTKLRAPEFKDRRKGSAAGSTEDEPAD